MAKRGRPPKRRLTQLDMIARDLEQGAIITPLDAIDKYGCLALAQRIKQLRDMGMDIITYANPNNTSYAHYQLRGFANDNAVR